MVIIMGNQLARKDSRFYFTSQDPDVAKTPPQGSAVPYYLHASMDKAIEQALMMNAGTIAVSVHDSKITLTVQGEEAGSLGSMNPPGTFSGAVTMDPAMLSRLKARNIRLVGSDILVEGDTVGMNNGAVKGQLHSLIPIPEMPDSLRQELASLQDKVDTLMAECKKLGLDNTADSVTQLQQAQGNLGKLQEDTWQTTRTFTERFADEVTATSSQWGVVITILGSTAAVAGAAPFVITIAAVTGTTLGISSGILNVYRARYKDAAFDAVGVVGGMSPVSKGAGNVVNGNAFFAKEFGAGANMVTSGTLSYQVIKDAILAARAQAGVLGDASAGDTVTVTDDMRRSVVGAIKAQIRIAEAVIKMEKELAQLRRISGALEKYNAELIERSKIQAIRDEAYKEDTIWFSALEKLQRGTTEYDVTSYWKAAPAAIKNYITITPRFAELFSEFL